MNEKYISLERIQTVNTSEGIFQRIFGLVRVQIETAGGTDGPEVSLTAITKAEAEQLKQSIFNRKKSLQEEEMTDEAGDLPGHLTVQNLCRKKSMSPIVWVCQNCFWLRPLQAVSESLYPGVSPSTRK